MILKHLTKAHELLATLDQLTSGMRALRAWLCERGKHPARRTRERRLKRLPDTFPVQIAVLDAELVSLIHPWAGG